MSNFENLKKLIQKYSIPREDLFMLQLGGKKIPIITRTGIEKIQNADGIVVKYTIENISPDHKFVVIKATATQGEFCIESFGEASPLNCKQTYPVAMAEKRALARSILKMTGFYREGLYSEDEFEPEVIRQHRINAPQTKAITHENLQD